MYIAIWSGRQPRLTKFFLVDLGLDFIYTGSGKEVQVKKVYAVYYIEIGTVADEQEDLDLALENLKEDIDDFIGSEWNYYLEDVIERG